MVLHSGFTQSNSAQITPFKPPVVNTSLGKNGNNSLVTPDEGKRIISLPISVTGADNTSYSIESYQFLFKKKSIIEDEKTGKKATAFTTVADLFKGTPLPSLWQKNITNVPLQKDEEFYFFDIVVKDDKGRKFFAPDLRIKIQ